MLKTSKIKTFWTVFFATVCAVSLAVVIAFSVSNASIVGFNSGMSGARYRTQEQNAYKQALYTACDGVKNLDANLGKVAVSTNTQGQVQLLTKAVVNANAVNMQLGNLPIEYSEKLENCIKFVNQAQDYSMYLIGQLSEGKQLTNSQRQALDELDNVATNMYNFLQEFAQSQDDGELEQTNQISLSDGLQQLDENAFVYEKLIYDGPFSDSVTENTIKCAETITTEQGSKIVEKHFGANEYSQTINGLNDFYVYQTENGRVLLTLDGRVCQYEEYFSLTNNEPLPQSQCIQVAEDFCNSLGYDVKGIWVSRTQDYVTYVNCAPVVNGVIVYPQLIKVAVSNVGNVVGMEAKAYLTNHDIRTVTFGNISKQTAQNALDSKLVVTNVSKALVQKDNKLYACYEFECNYNQRQYYVYVDSTTGQEVEIFKVINNTEGYTVM